MTLLAVFSDPHSNLEALTEVFRDMDRFAVDEVFCLGDLIGYGPQPQECCDLLRGRGVRLVQGNHEQGLINIHHLCGFNQPACDALRRTREMIDEATYQWLIDHPKSLTAFGCRFVHGLPPDSATEYLWKHEPEMGAVFGRFSEFVCFVGHTHDLMRFRFDRGKASARLPLPAGETALEPTMRHIVNVGAVGQPRDGDNRAKYVLYDTATRTVTLRRVPYDIRKTADLIVSRGFHRGFADRLW